MPADWNFNAAELNGRSRPSLELSTPETEPLNMSSSPTQSGTPQESTSQAKHLCIINGPKLFPFATVNVGCSATGDFLPMRLPNHCLVATTAYQYGFTPLVVSVGTTYFQRLAAADSRLKKVPPPIPPLSVSLHSKLDLSRTESLLL